MEKHQIGNWPKRDNDGNFIQLIQDKIDFIGQSVVNQYNIEDPVFLDQDTMIKNGDQNAIIIEIRFQRQLNNRMLTALLPTILINLVQYIFHFLDNLRMSKKCIVLN